MAKTLIVTLTNDTPMPEALALFDGMGGVTAVCEATEQMLEAELHRVRAQRQSAEAQPEQSN